MSRSGGRHAARRRRGRAGALRLVAALVALAVAVVVGGVVLILWTARSPDPEPVAAGAPAAASSSPAAASPSPAAASPTPTPTPPPTPSPPPAEPTFDRGQLSITDPASLWVVVDKARPLAPLDHVPADLVPAGDGHQLRAEAAQAMTAMLAAAAAEGLSPTVQSGYRSYVYQTDVFNDQVSRFGQARAELQVARPGYSEHQTGLAADIGGSGCDIESCFATTPEGRWVAAHGHRFGYVIRYPEGKQDVTGYKYEPWHIRYVGVALATEMHDTGVTTLEEFFGLPAAPGYLG